MVEIISVLSFLCQYLSSTTLRQLCRVVFGMLSMTGRVTMRNISRWTPQGGSYRTVQRLFNTVFPWPVLFWAFFREHFLNAGYTYILAGDECVESKSGSATYGLDRFFSSVYGKCVRGISFFAVSLVCVEERKSYPMRVEQIVRGASTDTPAPQPRSETRGGKPGRPKGSRNKDKCEVVLTDTLKQVQTMVKGLLADIGCCFPVSYLVLDGFFGHNNALQMTKQCGVSLISKLRSNAALYFMPEKSLIPKPGRPAIYGKRFNPHQIAAKYRICIETIGNITTEIYQMPLRSKAFADVLNVVCIQKTNLTTNQTSYVLLFSNDLDLEAEKLIDYYALRFQIEFNFRDAKQYWGLADFMNTGQTQVTNALNLSLFMVNVAEKLMAPFRGQNPEFSVLDLKARYRGAKYVAEVLKILPQEPEPIVIQQLNEHIGTIGAIHQIPQHIDTG